jgi:hypothetical protein
MKREEQTKMLCITAVACVGIAGLAYVWTHGREEAAATIATFAFVIIFCL